LLLFFKKEVLFFFEKKNQKTFTILWGNHPLSRAVREYLVIRLAGCVVEGPGRPGWCANHPYRCR
jgi:hypothetical protein